MHTRMHVAVFAGALKCMHASCSQGQSTHVHACDDTGRTHACSALAGAEHTHAFAQCSLAGALQGGQEIYVNGLVLPRLQTAARSQTGGWGPLC